MRARTKKPEFPQKRITPTFKLFYGGFIVICLCIILWMVSIFMSLQTKINEQFENKLNTIVERDKMVQIKSMGSFLNNAAWTKTLNTIEIRDVYPKYKRIIVIGDLHGDLKQTIQILKLTKLINENREWIANATILIQTGDIVDRGQQSIAVYTLFLKLRQESVKYGSLVLNQIGNHEHLNFINDFTYVNLGEIKHFGGIDKWKKMMSIESKLGFFLRNLPIARIIGSTLFVHAGILPSIAQKFGNNITTLNQEFHSSIMDLSINLDIDPITYEQTLTPYEQSLFGINSPIWTRYFEPAYYDMRMLQTVYHWYSINYNDTEINQTDTMPTQKELIQLFLCDRVDKILEIYNIKRIVTGHNLQENGRVKTECNEKLYGIDVGMSQFYGHNLAALEIDTKTDTVSIITDPDNPPHPIIMLQGNNLRNQLIALIEAQQLGQNSLT